MTYSDFINSLLTPFRSFFENFSTLSEALLSNYIFITILGLSLFIIIFTSIKDIILNFISSNKDIDNYADKKRGN